MQNIKHLYKVLVPSTLTWSFLVKQRVKLAASILRVVPLVFGQLTSSYVKVVFGFASNVVNLYKRQGARGCALYLKACSVALQQSAGGMVNHGTFSLGANIRRTRRGLPRIINPQHRVRIHLGEVGVIRFWLTLFGLYRVIEFPGALKLKTITNPGVDISLFMEEWKSWVPSFYERARLITDDPWKVKVTKLAPVSIPFMQKCSPNSGGFTSVMGLLWDILLMGAHPGMHTAVTQWLSTVDGVELTWAFNGVLKVLDAWILRKWDSKFEEMREDLRLGRNPKGSPLAMVVNWQSGMGTTSGTLHPLLPMTIDTRYLLRSWYLDHYWGKPLWFGRLAFLKEPGKIRVVAMVSLITQTLMYPLHEWIFSKLRLIPTDGTFDQIRPVKALIEVLGKDRWIASYDLSAATDRLPLEIQVELLKPLLGEKLVSLWAYLLVSQPYGLPRKAVQYRNLGTDRVWYAVGQPMGALSSWAMLALTHHAIVQLAASRAYPLASGWFLLYAVLGDDVVIGDRLVAGEYLRIMRALGVEIGLAKSLVSCTTSLEFAKRTFIRGQDCSPISLAEVMVARCNLGALGELVAKNMRFGAIRFSSVARFLGFGYRNLAQLPVGLGLGNRLSKVLAYLCRPGGSMPMPFEAWVYSVAPGGKDSAIADQRAWALASVLWETVLGNLLRRSARVAKTLFDVTMFDVVESSYMKKSTTEECADRKGYKGRKGHGVLTKFFGESLREFFNFEVLAPHLRELYKDWICYPYQLKLRRRFEKIDDTLRVLDPRILPTWSRLEGLWNEVVTAEEGIESLPTAVEFVRRPSDAKSPSTGLISLWVRLRTLATRESVPCSSVSTSFSSRRMPKRRRAQG